VLVFSSTNISLVSESKISHFLYSYYSANSFIHYLVIFYYKIVKMEELNIKILATKLKSKTIPKGKL